MTSTRAAELVLNADELIVASDRIGLHELPAIMAIRSAHPTVDRRAAAHRHAWGELMARGLVHADGVADGLASMLGALHRPDRELAMRLVTPDGTVRVRVVRCADRAVVACRTPDDHMAMRVISTEFDAACSALLAELPHSAVADVPPFAAPLTAFADALSESSDPRVLADRIRALGAEAKAAATLGVAFGTRTAYAEIAFRALSVDHDRIERVPAALGIFYTRRGRLLGAPTASPTQQLWVTVKPGSDHAVVQAIGRLVELSGQRWEDA
jgi:hypothetical protein